MKAQVTGARDMAPEFRKDVCPPKYLQMLL